MFFKKVDRIILFFYEEKYHKSLAKQRKKYMRYSASLREGNSIPKIF